MGENTPRDSNRPESRDAPITADDSENSGELDFPVVGVGASAGGLEAIEQLLRHLPPDSGTAVVFVQRWTTHRSSTNSHKTTPPCSPGACYRSLTLRVGQPRCVARLGESGHFGCGHGPR